MNTHSCKSVSIDLFNLPPLSDEHNTEESFIWVHALMSSFVANISSLAKIADPKTFNMVIKAAVKPMIQVNIPECYLSLVQDPPPKTSSRRMPVPAGKSHPPPARISHTGTKVWTHQASSCSGLAPSQTQVFQWWHHQGGLHYV